MQDKFCLVTGTSTGIGRHVAEALVNEGWQVMGLSRRDSGLQHSNYRHVRLDLGDPGAVTHFFEKEFRSEVNLAAYDRVGLVNNAALLDPVGPAQKMPLKALEKAFQVNAVVPIWLMGYFVRYCTGRSLRIVNVSSGAAHRPMPGWMAYCGTKAALRMASQVVALEHQELSRPAGSPESMAVCCFEPGVVDTPMQDLVRQQNPEDFPRLQRFLDLKSSGRLIPPEKPARAIVQWLESDPPEVFTETRFEG